MMIMKCPHCDETFITYRGLLKEYVYKVNGYYYCSYTCWRANGGGTGKRNRSRTPVKNKIIEEDED